MSLGAAYGAITKLTIGSYTSPGTATGRETLTTTGAITANAGMNVTGNVSMPGYLFCAGLVDATGTKITSTGRVAHTVARLSGYPAEVWAITFALLTH